MQKKEIEIDQDHFFLFRVLDLKIKKWKTKTTFAKEKRSLIIKNWYWLFGKKENNTDQDHFFLFSCLGLKKSKT